MHWSVHALKNPAQICGIVSSWLVAFLLGTTVAVGQLPSGSSARNARSTAGLNSINHIIVLLQENRSFDHYFGELRQYWADNGYPDQSFDGLPEFNPVSGPPPRFHPP